MKTTAALALVLAACGGNAGSPPAPSPALTACMTADVQFVPQHDMEPAAYAVYLDGRCSVTPKPVWRYTWATLEAPSPECVLPPQSGSTWDYHMYLRAGPCWGRYVMSLTVEDYVGGTSSVTRELQLGEPQPPNLPPVARGTVQTHCPGSSCSGVTLDASGSTDPEGSPLMYQWRGVPQAAGCATIDWAPTSSPVVDLTMSDLPCNPGYIVRWWFVLTVADDRWANDVDYDIPIVEVW